jgi:hypothetical protein
MTRGREPDIVVQANNPTNLEGSPDMTHTTARGRLPWRLIHFAAAFAVVAMLLAPAGASAASPTQVTDTTYGARPPRIVTPAGTLDFFMFFSDVNGPVAELVYWAPGEDPAVEPADVGIEGPTISVNGDVVTGDLWVHDSATHEPLGLAVYRLEFTPVGPATFEDAERQDGNIRFRQWITRQDMAVSGTLTMPNGVELPIETEGGKDVFVTWTTSPAAVVDDGFQQFVGADWTIDEQPLMFRTVRTAIAAEAVLILVEPGGEVAGFVNPIWTDDGMVADMELVRAGDVVGSAHVELTVTSVSSSSHFELYPGKRLKVTEEELAVVGSATVTVDGVTRSFVIDASTGFGQRQTWHGAQRPIKGGDDGGGEG